MSLFKFLSIVPIWLIASYLVYLATAGLYGKDTRKRFKASVSIFLGGAAAILTVPATLDDFSSSLGWWRQNLYGALGWSVEAEPGQIQSEGPRLNTRSIEQMIQQIRYDIPTVKITVYEDEPTVFAIKSNLGTRPLEFTFEFIEELTCSFKTDSPYLDYAEIDDCLYSFTSDNTSGERYARVPGWFSVCHQSSSLCAEGHVQFSVEKVK